MKVRIICYFQLSLFFLVDHILLMEADDELIRSININSNEVKAIKFVPVSELNFQNELTPWLQKIVKSNLLAEWIEDFKLSSSSDTNRQFVKTKYSNEPIIKL